MKWYLFILILIFSVSSKVDHLLIYYWYFFSFSVEMVPSYSFVSFSLGLCYLFIGVLYMFQILINCWLNALETSLSSLCFSIYLVYDILGHFNLKKVIIFSFVVMLFMPLFKILFQTDALKIFFYIAFTLRFESIWVCFLDSVILEIFEGLCTWQISTSVTITVYFVHSLLSVHILQREWNMDNDGYCFLFGLEYLKSILSDLRALGNRNNSFL